MSRLTRRIIGATLAFALLGAVVASVAWVTTTTRGARWLLEKLVPLSGVTISARTVAGSINDQLSLSGVRVDTGQQQLELGSLRMRWKPLLLLAGTVAVQELVIDGVRIQDNTPADTKPPQVSWPRLPEGAHLFDGIIAQVKVTDISYRRLREEPLAITSLSGSLNWQGDRLSISNLILLSPAGRISGSLSAGFRRPALTTDLALTLEQPRAELDRFTLQVRPAGSTGSEQISATITLAGSSGSRRLLDISGDAGLERNKINLRRLRLSRPGQKGLLTADGTVVLTTREPLLTLQVTASGLDLAPQLKTATNLSGTLTFAGTLNNYRGSFNLVNQVKGWQTASVSATYRGTDSGLKLAPLTATFLDGTLAGNLDVAWRDGIVLGGELSGRGLNPARLDPAWHGVANFTADGRVAWSGTTPLNGSINATLLESRLHGQALSGILQAGFAGGGNVSLTRLELQGRGFDLQATGELKQNIMMTARISDLSRLVPGAAGSLQGSGRLRWRDGQLTGDVSGNGNRLSYGRAGIAALDLKAKLEQGAGYPLQISAALRDILYDGYRLSAATLAADGTLAQHSLKATLRSGSTEARLSLNAGYTSEPAVWKGTLTALAGRDSSGPWNLAAPAAFRVSSGTFTLAPLALTAGAGERLEVAADLGLKPLIGKLRAKWSGLNLSRANPWLKDARVSGSSNGTVLVGFLPEKRLTLAGNAALSGTFSGQRRSLTIQRSMVTFDGNQGGLRVAADLTIADGGGIKLNFSSAAPFRLTMPEKGELSADVNGIDLALFRHWLPADTLLAGRISARASGNLLPGQRFDLSGTASVKGGTVHQKRPDGELKLAFSSASGSWEWRGAALGGSLALTTAENGQVQGNFQLPLAAHFPLAINPAGPLQAALTGHVQEKGLVTALFPGLVQESSGELDSEVAVNGTWEAPQVSGKLRLSRAGAYLPTAGVHLKEVQMAARLEKNLIRVDSFRALSGPGHIEGTALITLDNWQVKRYEGSLRGENFQTVYFPELRMLSAPTLTFEGTPQKLTLRGELRLPELNIIGSPSRTAISPSSDVIREGRVEPAAGRAALALDVKIKVLLGDKVFVKVSGIDAQLGGAVDLSMSRLDSITSTGEIKVIKGRYRTYGVNLEIVRGRLFFAGGPINQPSLDVLALRTIGDVRAGVTVTGTLRKPLTRLYSEPAMPDVDVLAYIVLGHPLGSGGEQASLMTQAAGALLSTGQAAVLQDQLKNKLGLSTLEIQGGVGGTSGAMGYKPLQVTAPGAIPAAQQPGITETVLTVGKYLTPQLYISYGKSLFTGSNLFKLRYDVFRHWQIETQTGSGESGADLYYKMEFK